MEKYPRKEQLIQVIRDGNDSNNNYLVLDIDANYCLNDFDLFDIEQEHPEIVVRYETFAANHDYVGKKASEDINSIDQLYNITLEYWQIYLDTGKTDMYAN